jgi:hypothetical protein
MKTRIDWNRAAWNSLHTARHATGHLLVGTGRLTLAVGRLVRGLGRRLAPSVRPFK